MSARNVCAWNIRLKRLLDHAYSEGYHFHCRSIAPPLLSGKFVDGGVLILSRYPIVEKDGFVYKDGNQIDAWAAKQVIYAKVQLTANQYLHVFTTHMQASYYDTAAQNNAINDRMRIGQVNEIAAFVAAKTRGSTDPIAITGDFNISAKDAADETKEAEDYTYLMTTLKSALEDGGRLTVTDLLKEDNNGTHPNTYADICPDERTKPRETVLTNPADHCTQLAIDYIFWADTVANQKSEGVKREMGSTRVEQFFVSGHAFTQLSDHYGVSTVFRVKQEPAQEK